MCEKLDFGKPGSHQTYHPNDFALDHATIEQLKIFHDLPVRLLSLLSLSLNILYHWCTTLKLHQMDKIKNNRNIPFTVSSSISFLRFFQNDQWSINLKMWGMLCVEHNCLHSISTVETLPASRCEGSWNCLGNLFSPMKNWPCWLKRHPSSCHSQLLSYLAGNGHCWTKAATKFWRLKTLCSNSSWWMAGRRNYYFVDNHGLTRENESCMIEKNDYEHIYMLCSKSFAVKQLLWLKHF